MKLRNKLLSVLPLATLGVATPIAISSCSCGNSYSISFGDSINCSDQKIKDPAYHSINDVKTAAKTHVQVLPEGEKIDWENDKTNQEFIYWDLVYSLANKDIKFILTWTFKEGSLLEKGTYNGSEFTSINYNNDSGIWYLTCNGTNIVESYARSQNHE